MKKLLFFITLMFSPMLASAQTVSDVQNSGCMANARGVESEESVPTIILKKEGTILSVELQNYISNCATYDFEIKSSISDGIDGSPCSLSVNVAPVLPEQITTCDCPFNVSFTIRDFEPNSFYLDCWWYKGLVELTEGEPLVLEDVYEDATIDGMNFTLRKAFHQAMVTRSEWVGEVRIPSELSHEGQTYSVTSISSDAFTDNTTMTKVFIPRTIKNMNFSEESGFNRNLFSWCSALESIEVEEGNPVLCSVGGVLFNKEKTRLYTYPAADSRTSYTVPEGVTWIDGSAFASNHHLVSISLPDGVTSLGSSAFYDCTNLEEVNLPYGLKSLAGYLFCNCSSLTDIQIPKSVTSVMSNAFKGCKALKTLDLPESVTFLGDYVFSGCKLDSLIIRGVIDFSWNGHYWLFDGMGTETKVYVHPTQVDKFKAIYKGPVYPLPEQKVDYIPFAELGKQWHVVSAKNPNYVCRQETYWMFENVERAGKIYAHTICNDDELDVTEETGLFREENRRVYKYDETEGRDIMLYDFSLKEGDTFAYEFGFDQPINCKVLKQGWLNDGPQIVYSCTLTPADTLDIKYRRLRTWTIGRDNGLGEFVEVATWVEGIGALENMFNSFAFGGVKSCLAYVERKDNETVYHVNEYLPFSFCNGYDVMGHVHGCDLPTGAEDYGENDGHHQLTYELKGNSLHVYGEVFTQCGPNNYAYFYVKKTDDPLVNKIEFEIQEVGPVANCVALHATDFYVPGFDPNMNYIVVDNRGEEHPVINKPPEMTYRPMIEEGKVWKVGTISGNPVQIVDYYYFDGDTIIDGKTCKQMMRQRYVNPDIPDYGYYDRKTSLIKIGAWYEEDKKVYFYNLQKEKDHWRIKYDFSLEANDTLQSLNVDGSSPFIIGPRQTGGIDGFKGVYRDIMMCADEGQNIHSTFWLEGIGDINGPTRIPYNPILDDAVPEFLMSCTVGDEVIYLNDNYEDGATPEGMTALKKRFDFTHTTKLQPKAPVKRENSDASISSSEREVARPKVKTPRRTDEELSLYGEYNDKLLGINLDPLDDAYQVSITNESGKAVYKKTVNAGTIVGLSIDISAYAKGRYTVTVENSNELFTGEFETETTGIEETIYNKVETKTEIYNLQGQRIHSLQKGLNIYGGRKIVK